MDVVILNKKGWGRVPGGEVGMTFIVDKFTESPDGKVAHIRDYRYPNRDLGTEFQVWSLPADGYAVVG